MELVTSSLLVGFVVFLASALISRIYRGNGKMPPGPPSYPLIGNLAGVIGKDQREVMKSWAKKYGDVFTFDMGNRKTVVLSSYDVIKEAFVKYSHVFSNRPMDLFFIQEITEGYGIVSTNGELWREQRKFTHGVFREFGVGRVVFEDVVNEEISHFMMEFKNHLNKPYDPEILIQMAISNVINNVVFGERFDYDDEKFIGYMNIMNKNFEVLGNIGPLTVFPALRYLPGDLFGYKTMRVTTDYMFKEYYNQINKHREERVPGVLNSFIDAYLDEMDKQSQDKQSTFTDKQLMSIIGDLFGAGTETTTTTLRWGIVHMLRNPDVMLRVQKEIDDVIGPSRAPSMKDKLSMPFTEAVLLEIQRMGDIVPLGVPHACKEDVQFRGFHIPAGTWVLPFHYAVHRDERVWDEPYKFNPCRFLSEDGSIKKDERMIPFSMGKRVCLGESLAKMELFLFFTSILQHMSMKIPEGQDEPKQDGLLGITHGPHPYTSIFELRN